MKTIIIPTDFSAVATNAVQYGIDMAKTVNAHILLVHIYSVPISYSDMPVALISVEDLQKSAEDRMTEFKKEVEHISSGSPKIYTETRLGSVADELEDICNNIQPFAVVMGTKGTSGVEKILFGSTALNIIRHLTWPVICVPPGKTFGTGIKKIGFACDFRNVAQTTPANVIKEFAKEFHAELHVLNVDHGDHHFQPNAREESLLLHTMLEDADPEYHFIEHRDVEEGINEFAEKNNLDLVISIPKKHNLLEGIFRKAPPKSLSSSPTSLLCVYMNKLAGSPDKSYLKGYSSNKLL